MSNAKRPAGPTKPIHIERENAIEREQIDEALGIGAAAAEGAEEPLAEAEVRTAPRSGSGSDRKSAAPKPRSSRAR
jgi:hypothetical protein